jgi:phage shock protein E
MTAWALWIILGGTLALLLLKRFSQVSAAKAQECMKAGAAVIDVRSRQEFESGHLPGALNIPLDQLAEGIGRAVPEKTRPILLHCLSGGRSGIAQLNLKRMGYTDVHNLGSYARARKLLGT